MPILRVVQFGFKELCTPEEIQALCDQMLGLKDSCIHPATNRPYIKSAIGGIDNSPDGIQGDVTHVFISEFESVEDRDYCLGQDPAYQTLKENVGKVVATVRVVDFTPGVF